MKVQYLGIFKSTQKSPFYVAAEYNCTKLRPVVNERYSMASPEINGIITDFCSHFALKIDKVSFLLDKIPTAQVNGKDEIQGLRNLVSQVSSPSNPEHEIVQEQWIEYVLTHLGNIDNSVKPQVLKDLNGYIADKVYFVGDKLGPIDVLVYYLLYSVVLNLTFQEKEKYLNFSRWFNNIQRNEKARLGRMVIPFSKSQLYV